MEATWSSICQMFKKNWIRKTQKKQRKNKNKKLWHKQMMKKIYIIKKVIHKEKSNVDHRKFNLSVEDVNLQEILRYSLSMALDAKKYYKSFAAAYVNLILNINAHNVKLL
jgi:hypothetical protein